MLLGFFSRRRQSLHDRDLLGLASAGASRTRARVLCATLGFVLGSSAVAEVENRTSPKCYEDAMLIFDASGSMSGMEEWGSSSLTSRIDDARKALADSLPRVTPLRRLGLMTYGPGPVGRCDNIILNLRPEFEAGPRIMAEVNALVPDGRTPLTSAVARAANVLDYRNKPGIIVLLTDGSETCGGEPCALAQLLKDTGKAITVHVLGYRMKDIISTHDAGVKDMQCLASHTGGLFIPVDTIDELIAALNKTLGCPLVTRREEPGGSFVLPPSPAAG